MSRRGGRVVGFDGSMGVAGYLGLFPMNSVQRVVARLFVRTRLGPVEVRVEKYSAHIVTQMGDAILPETATTATCTTATGTASSTAATHVRGHDHDLLAYCCWYW